MRIELGAPAVFVNDQRTRTFLALSAAAAGPAAPPEPGGGGGPLLRAIERVGRGFRLHGLEEFYADPRPHISLAWLLGDAEAAALAALEGRAVQAAAAALARCRWSAEPRSIECCVGKKVHSVWRLRERERAGA